MGNSIQEESGIPCVCNDFTGEVLRGIRMHATRFMKDLEESDMNKVSSASLTDLPASSMPQNLLWLKNMHVGVQRLYICSCFINIFGYFTIGWHSIICLKRTAPLRCAVMYCTVLRCAALCCKSCAVLCCAVLCCAVLCCAVLCCAAALQKHPEPCADLQCLESVSQS